MLMYMVIIFNLLFFIVLPIVVIVLVVRHFINKNKKNGTNKPVKLGLRELLLGCLMLCATVTGITGVVMIPKAVFDADDITKSSLALIVYITASLLFLILGVLLKNLTGKYLMILGILLLIFSVVPFVSNMGKSAGFIAVLVAFIVLVALVVKSSKKENHG